MMNDYALKSAQQEVACGAGRYIPPTKRQQLEAQKDMLEASLAKINDALNALDAHPELEKFIDVIQAAGL